MGPRIFNRNTLDRPKSKLIQAMREIVHQNKYTQRHMEDMENNGIKIETWKMNNTIQYMRSHTINKKTCTHHNIRL